MSLPPGPYRVKASGTIIKVREDGVVIAQFKTEQGHTIEAVLTLDVPPTAEEAEAAQRITAARNQCVTTLMTKYADQLDAVTDYINASEKDGEEHWLSTFFKGPYNEDTFVFVREWLIEDFEESL